MDHCQLLEVDEMTEGLSRIHKWWQLKRRIPRFIKNRFILLRYTISKGLNKKDQEIVNHQSLNLHPSDRVRIRPKEEIMKTLDGWRRYRGCRFMDEMWQYCGGTYKVLKRVNYMLDERSMKMKKCKNMVILNGLMCNGSWPFEECDRSCYFFWKEAWLEKVDCIDR